LKYSGKGASKVISFPVLGWNRVKR